jgi:hypothetical protein
LEVELERSFDRSRGVELERSFACVLEVELERSFDRCWGSNWRGASSGKSVQIKHPCPRPIVMSDAFGAAHDLFPGY